MLNIHKKLGKFRFLIGEHKNRLIVVFFVMLFNSVANALSIGLLIPLFHFLLNPTSAIDKTNNEIFEYSVT